MDTNHVCKLCLMSKNEIIEILGEEGIKLNITEILEQYFSFQVCIFISYCTQLILFLWHQI